MTTRDALLAAIADNPDDDTPRLVFADYLEESGNPVDTARAKLIRAQVRASRLTTTDPERTELKNLADALWDRHKSGWFPGVSSSRLPHPQRGFITSWGCYSASDIVESAPPFSHEPITEVTLAVKRPEELAGVELWPDLSRVRELKVWPTTTDDSALVRLFSSPYLSGLRKLDLMGNIARPWSPVPETMGVLATLPQYATLENLSVTHAEVGDEGARRLAASHTLRQLSGLGLSGCDVGRAGWAALLASPVVASVRSLALGGSAQTDEAGEALAAALAHSPHLDKLEGLVLDETAFTDRAAQALSGARWPAFKRLLICPHAANHSDQVTGLATMTAQGLELLVMGSWAASIESLYLSGHTFSDDGAVALARGRGLQNLRSLTLMSSGITARGLSALVEAYSEQLELLQLARNPLGDAGAEVIARAKWPSMVPQPEGQEYSQRGILVARCGIGEAGAKALARSTTIPREIPDLFIGDAAVSDSVVARLKARFAHAIVRF